MRTFELDEGALRSLEELSVREQRPVPELAANLLAHALNERREADENLACWRLLSPREQQVAALVCLEYTNREIAVRLGLSPETVKTHVHSVLTKYDLHTRQQLRHKLAAWDFSSWD